MDCFFFLFVCLFENFGLFIYKCFFFFFSFFYYPTVGCAHTTLRKTPSSVIDSKGCVHSALRHLPQTLPFNEKIMQKKK